MFKHTLVTVLGVIALLAGLGFVLATAAHASGITGSWNTPMCGSNSYERVKTPLTEYAVSDSSDTCVSSQRYHASFAVSRVLANKGWQYPNIALGYTPEGAPTCASSADTCFGFPVQVKHDGTPEQSFGSWISSGYQGNLADDIWFSPTESRHSVATRNGDTELMVWFAYPGIHDKLSDYTTIDGKRFGVMTWEAGHDGARWRYVAYLWLNAPNGSKGRQVNISGLWLNPFFRNAESHGWLSQNDYMWAIDDGFEMNHDGLDNNIHSQLITGLPEAH